MKLDKQTIVRAAVDLLDRAGLEGLTMRKLAEALHVQAPAIYWHFPNKQALLDEMAEALLEGVPATLSDSPDVADVLTSLAVQLRHALLSRRDGGRVFAGTFIARANTMQLADIGFAAMARAGIDSQSSARGLSSILYFVLGFVIEEQALAEQSASPDDRHPLSAKLSAVQPGRYPYVEAVLPDLLDTDQEARFHFGLDLLVTGLTAKQSLGCR